MPVKSKVMKKEDQGLDISGGIGVGGVCGQEAGESGCGRVLEHPRAGEGKAGVRGLKVGMG
jgi:hypothetical protein